MTQASPSTARATRSLNSSSGTSVQFGPHASASSSTCGTPNLEASSAANLVLPAPVDPITETLFKWTAAYTPRAYGTPCWFLGGGIRYGRKVVHKLVLHADRTCARG